MCLDRVDRLQPSQPTRAAQRDQTATGWPRSTRTQRYSKAIARAELDSRPARSFGSSSTKKSVVILAQTAAKAAKDVPARTRTLLCPHPHPIRRRTPVHYELSWLRTQRALTPYCGGTKAKVEA